MRKRMTIRELLERHPEVERMDAFYFCDVAVPEFGDYAFYCCIVLARHPKGGFVTEEFRCTSEYALAFRLGEAGVEAPPPEELARLCRSAPRNPPLPRRRKPAADALASPRPVAPATATTPAGEVFP